MARGRIVTFNLLMGLAIGCSKPAECPLPTPSADAAPFITDLFVSGGNPYSDGVLATRSLDLAPCELGAPVALRIFTPTAPGHYPVVVFQHGFVSQAIWYSEILTHLATHGFVVIAPQMYPPDSLPTSVPPTQEEIALALRVLDWLPGHLQEITGVEADTTLVGLAGHSRGGKVAWGVLAQDSTRAKAVAGLDPVDGSFAGQARVVQGPFDFPFPSLVLGVGLAGWCAPDGDNHEQFYGASAPPAWHVAVPRAGHADFYDGDCGGCLLLNIVCQRGDDPAGTRRLAGGLLVAFFRAALQGDGAAYAYLADDTLAPVSIQVESK